MESLIFEDDDIEVYALEAQSTDTIILTFSEIGASAGAGAWGGQALAKNGISYIGFVSKRPNWFPLASMIRATAVIKPITDRYAVIAGYGHSQGGYAAIRYAATFGIDVCIAFCPQFSIDPTHMAGEDNRFTQYFTSSEAQREIVATDVPADCRVYLFYDPSHHLDNLNVQHIATAVPTARKVKIFGTGHQTVRVVARSATVARLLHAAIVNNEFEIYRTIREAKLAWSKREIYMSRALSSSNPALAVKLLDRHVGAVDFEVSQELVVNLYNTKQFEALARNAAKIAPNCTGGWAHVLLRAFIAADRSDLVLQYGPAWLWFEGIHDAIAQSLFDSVTAGAIALQDTHPTTRSVIYGEGWHPAEEWGRWGSAIRSRIVIVGPSTPGETIGIPAKPFSGDRQTLTVRYHSHGVWHDAQRHDDRVHIVLDPNLTAIDFMIDGLFSPRDLGLHGDTRNLGVQLPDAQTWLP